jgi:hypothetical protein
MTSTYEFTRLVNTHLRAAVEERTCVIVATFIYISTPRLFGISRVKFKAWVAATLVTANEVGASIGTSTVFDEAFIDIFTRGVTR